MRGQSNLPPGCTVSEIERAQGEDTPCACCGELPDCSCPTCEYCGAVGDPRCYEEVQRVRKCVHLNRVNRGIKPVNPHPVPAMTYSREQRVGQIRLRIAQVQEIINDDEFFLMESAIKDVNSDFYINDQDFRDSAIVILKKYKRWLNET